MTKTQFCNQFSHASLASAVIRQCGGWESFKEMAQDVANHGAALAMVDKVRDKAIELDSRAFWYAFGTCRIPADDSVPIRCGLLNKYFGMEH